MSDFMLPCNALCWAPFFYKIKCPPFMKMQHSELCK